jgi:hypothetical protein
VNLPDSYVWQARVAPALVAGLPAATLLVGGLLAPTTLGKLGSVGLAILLFVVPQLVRDAGVRLQSELWRTWGGSPTRRRLRFHGATNAADVERRHRQLEAVIGERLPGPEEEMHDPEAAEAAYERAEVRLRDVARDKDRFPLLFDENKNYGMRRNMLGIRRWGLGVAFATLTICAAAFALSEASTCERLRAWAAPAAVSAVMLLLWWRVVTPEWVRRAGETYADRFFAASRPSTQKWRAPVVPASGLSGPAWSHMSRSRLRVSRAWA